MRLKLVSSNMDKFVFLKINDLAGRFGWLDWLAVFFADYAGYILLAVVLGILIFKKTFHARKMVFGALIAAVISRGVIVTVIKSLYYRPRPFEVLQVTQLIPENNSSFPSGHAALYFAIAVAIYFYNKKMGVIFLITSGLMGLARIYVGVHWPTDILAGLMVGVITVLLMRKTKLPFREYKS